MRLLKVLFNAKNLSRVGKKLNELREETQTGSMNDNSGEPEHTKTWVSLNLPAKQYMAHSAALTHGMEFHLRLGDSSLFLNVNNND